MSKQLTLIKEWQTILLLKHNVKRTEKQLFQIIKDTSKKNNININESILMIDKLIRQDNINTLNIGNIENSNNSCYMDSILIILLCKKITFIDTNLLYLPTNNINLRFIQDELKNIQKSIINKEKINCDKLRNLIKRLPKNENFEDFSLDKPQDAGEFLKFLFQIFKIENCTNIQVVYGTNVLTRIVKQNDVVQTNKTFIKNCLPIFDIFNQHIKDSTLSNIIKTYDDSGVLSNPYIDTNTGEKYKRRLELILPYDYKYLVFNVHRINFNQKITNKNIIPDEMLILENDIQLNLFGIVAWINGHYVSCLKIYNEWWYHDDFLSVIPKIGNYEKMCEFNDNFFLKFGMLYFYFI